MGALTIPSAYDQRTMLIVDDEPEHLEWLVDFAESLGLKVTIAVNVKQAMQVCNTSWFRIYVIDLNIPLGGWPEQSNRMFANYPGFAIIQAIRSQGNDGRRVIAYSAHSNEQIIAEMKRLYTDFLAKGRPIQLKDRIREVLTQPDQTASTLTRVEARVQRRKQALVAKKLATKLKAPAKAKTSVKPRTASKAVTSKSKKKAESDVPTAAATGILVKSPLATPKIKKSST